MGWARPISLRTQVALALVLLTAFTAGLLGQMMYRSARSLIRETTMRSVAFVAESRRVVLVETLRGDHDRLTLSLEAILDACATESCLSDRIGMLRAREQAEVAFLVGHAAGTIVAGRAELVPAVPTHIPGLLAQFFADPQGNQLYSIVHTSHGSTLTVVYPSRHVAGLFRTGPEIGREGETFLADARGYFITPGKHGDSAGHSHPIDALPMRRCLAGENAEAVAPDYRGVLVIHGFRYVREIGGGCIMAHIEANEAFAPVRALGMRALGISSALAISSLLLALLLSRRLTQPIVVRDEALRVVAHDLRNPLNNISLTASLLEQQWPNELAGQGKLLDIIKRSVERGNQLVQDLLDVARTQAGHLPLERKPLDPGELVRESVEFDRPLADARSVRLSTQVTPDLPVIHGDLRRLQQVFSNLISNAVKFSPQGTEVTISAQPGEEAVVFAVSDKGPGIDKADSQKLFSPFVQAAARRTGGTGLGLAICRGIVEAHGGRIWVDSIVGQGSTFYFTLPLTNGTDAHE